MTAKIPGWDNATTEQKLALLHDAIMNAAGRLTQHESAIGDLFGRVKKLEEK